jgi:hypothetical protein
VEEVDGLPVDLRRELRDLVQGRLPRSPPAMLALNLGMLDADFRIDAAAAPELAEYLRTLSARYTRATG